MLHQTTRVCTARATRSRACADPRHHDASRPCCGPGGTLDRPPVCQGTASHSLRRCVFAACLLCVRAFCSALLVLQASDACPGTLQIITHCDVQRAAALTGELDVVAVHERIEPSMVGAGCENVAGVQRVNRGDPFNAARNLMRHVVSVEILHDNTVVC